MKKLILAVTLLLAFGLATTAMAEDSTDNSKTKWQEKREEMKEKHEERKEAWEEKKEERQEKKEERIEKRCEKIEQRIANRISKYEDRKENDTLIFDKLTTRLDSLIGRLEERGVDAADLKSKVDSMKAMVDDLRELQDAFIAELKKTEDLACGESEGAFKEQLQATKEDLNAVRDKVTEIRNYYRDTVRPAIIDLKGSLHSEGS